MIRVSLIVLEKGQRDYDVVADAEYTAVVATANEVKAFCETHKNVSIRNVKVFFDFEEVGEDMSDEEFDEVDRIINSYNKELL